MREEMMIIYPSGLKDSGKNIFRKHQTPAVQSKWEAILLQGLTTKEQGGSFSSCEIFRATKNQKVSFVVSQKRVHHITLSVKEGQYHVLSVLRCIMIQNTAESIFSQSAKRACIVPDKISKYCITKCSHLTSEVKKTKG